MHFIELVPTCNDSSLAYFFDHDDKDNTPIFYLFPVSNVILNWASNHKHIYINKKTRSPTTTATALLTSTSSVTSFTKPTNPVPVPAVQSSPIQVKQPADDSYYFFTDEISAHNPAMNPQNQVCFLILLPTTCRKEVFPRINAIQYQDIFNNIIAQSDGLFKTLFWNNFVQQIVYHYLGEFNLNSQAILSSNNFILLTSATSAHSDSDPSSEKFINLLVIATTPALMKYLHTTRP